LKNIFDSGELFEDEVSSKMEHTNQHSAIAEKHKQERQARS
jgi:hypothetical protein